MGLLKYIQKIFNSNIFQILSLLAFNIIVSSGILFAINKVEWPATNSSNVTHTLTTGLQTVCIIFLIGLITYSQKFHQKTLIFLANIFLCALTTITLGLPLGATKLYLMGLSVDQQFRTEYLTRFASSAHLGDMTYTDLPAFYPPTWFWIGGRVANLLNIPAWEIFKPYAIVSLVLASGGAFYFWTKLVNLKSAILIALISNLILLQFNSDEPYSAVVGIFALPTLIFFSQNLANTIFGKNIVNWKQLTIVGIILGISAQIYTLFTGVIVLSLILILLIHLYRYLTINNKKLALLVIIQIIYVAIISTFIALISWLPYLAKWFSTAKVKSGIANQYLPNSGSVFSFPLIQFNLIGMLTFIGFIWIIINFRKNIIAKTIGIAIISTYLWELLSMFSVLLKTTLLGFRTIPLLYLFFATAGTIGISSVLEVFSRKSKSYANATIILTSIATVAVAQGIPASLAESINTAYRDTDGAGYRADRRPAGAEQYYAEINKFILSTTHKTAEQLVVLTTDFSFLSIYPYWGFQSLTPHYANPLAEFDARSIEIQTWATANTSTNLLAQLNHCPWKTPDVFLFRTDGKDFTLRLASNTYPNDPNVKRFYVTFSQKLFPTSRFSIKKIGPFAVVVIKT